ncbi:MAG: bifunctional DNA-binding transcriptional regulator/O6-methylguanine-DNA methyltransferase Ada [Cyanobacteria bacterium REEB67]|nr:bifunctional DNA-binding transcriptional regulator/O6-methylguanine-DNA methyltransferase Ada [Cyanobacteria bacterium REEB67]
MTREHKESTGAAATTEEDPRWLAVLRKDKAADGSFFYGVRTTGVFCRPSCAARPAKPENVSFHTSIAAAEQAGFRPCKRCKPDQQSSEQRLADLIIDSCRFIEQCDSAPALATLADRAGLSPYHFHRLFKARTGLTPKAYGAAQIANRMRAQLDENISVTEAIFNAGYNSSSRFYEKSDRLLGMTASKYKSGGDDMEIRFAVGESTLGAVLVAQSQKGICAIFLGDDAQALVRSLQDRFPRATFIGGDDRFEKLVALVVGFVQAPAAGLDLPLDIRGTAFQQRVWQALQAIPTGKTMTYGEIAKMIGAPGAVRAVGTACGANPLAVVIPCHRVVKTSGDLSGYRWGVERKRALLDSERQ